VKYTAPLGYRELASSCRDHLSAQRSWTCGRQWNDLQPSLNRILCFRSSESVEAESSIRSEFALGVTNGGWPVPVTVFRVHQKDLGRRDEYPSD